MCTVWIRSLIDHTPTQSGCRRQKVMDDIFNYTLQIYFMDSIKHLVCLSTVNLTLLTIHCITRHTNYGLQYIIRSAREPVLAL